MNTGLIAIAAALAIGIPAFATAWGQGNTGARAVESMARQPEISGKIQTAMIIALSMMEALTIYGLLIGIMLIGKI